jgi:hypothetical protein
MKHPTCEIDDDYHLLIPSRFPPVPLYERLGSVEIREAAEALEAKTNPRLQEINRLTRSGQQVGGSERLQNWNHAPFTYPNPEGTTFLNPAYRVLELVRGVQAALAIAVLRREAFLAASDEPPINVEMREIVRRVKGRFVDLTGANFETNQVKRWELGAKIYESNAQGIVFQRPDLPGIQTVAIFDQGVLGRAVQAQHYRFVWDGKAVRAIGNFSTGEVIDRDQLFADLARRAAA